jgi:hypothetical protein
MTAAANFMLMVDSNHSFRQQQRTTFYAAQRQCQPSTPRHTAAAATIKLDAWGWRELKQPPTAG